MQQVFSALSNIKSNIVAYDFIKHDVKKSKLRKIQEISNFKLNNINKIEFNDISFRYKKDSLLVFDQASISFKKNNIYAITGESGVGKTSLLDLISGCTFDKVK